jgi:hypothetical protein
VCIEKLHRAPEECDGVKWQTLWELVALAEEEAERMDRLARDQKRSAKGR